MLKNLIIALVCVVFSVQILAEKAFAEEALANDKKESEKAEAGKNGKQSATEQPSNTVKLESIFIGDKEQPAISYFIPWQGVGTPDKLHWNVEEKHDNALGLVDREIMLRSIHFYEEMNLEQSQ